MTTTLNAIVVPPVDDEDVSNDAYHVDEDRHASNDARTVDNDNSGRVDPVDPGSFNFLDPDLVIQAVYLVPRLAGGRTPMFLGPSFVRPESDEDEDWCCFYMSM
jgi:hypothetical protein